MTIYHTFIDDTIGDGSATIAGIQENASAYGIGVTSTYKDIIADNISVGVITATTLVGQVVGGASQIQDGAEIVGLVTFSNTFIKVGSADTDGHAGAAITISSYGVNVSGITTVSAFNATGISTLGIIDASYIGVTTAITVGTRINHNGMDARRGPVVSGTITNAGAGYTNGTYTNVLFTGGSGELFRADVTVASNVVSSVTLTDEGWGYYAGDVLTLTTTTNPGNNVSATPMEYTLNSVRDVDAVFYGNPVKIRLQNSDSSTAANQEMGSILFGTRDASTGGSGDKARIVCRSRSTSGGGYFLFQTSANAAEPIDSLRLLDGSALFYNNVNVGLSTNGKTLTHYGTLGVYNATGGQTTAYIFCQGNIDANGTKNFRISHPLESLSETHDLVHSAVESPQIDLIYRGKSQLSMGRTDINIDNFFGMTEGTFSILNRNVQCFTTNETGWDPVRGSVTGNILTIECKNVSSTDYVSWMVVGERQDRGILNSSSTDENGKLIVEPLKPPTTP